MYIYSCIHIMVIDSHPHVRVSLGFLSSQVVNTCSLPKILYKNHSACYTRPSTIKSPSLGFLFALEAVALWLRSLGPSPRSPPLTGLPRCLVLVFYTSVFLSTVIYPLLFLIPPLLTLHIPFLCPVALPFFFPNIPVRSYDLNNTIN